MDELQLSNDLTHNRTNNLKEEMECLKEERKPLI